MRTPYDGALRVLGREVDEMGAAVRAAADRLAEVEAQRRDMGEAIARETAMATALQSAFPAHAYLKRVRAERDAMTALCEQADAALASLRDDAREKYGSLRLVEGAAERFREEAGRELAQAEQARIDDFTGAQLARVVRRVGRGR